MACINRFLLVILDHQESLDAQSREPQQAGEEEMEPDQGEDVPPSDELPQVINEIDTYSIRYVCARSICKINLCSGYLIGFQSYNDGFPLNLRTIFQLTAVKKL